MPRLTPHRISLTIVVRCHKRLAREGDQHGTAQDCSGWKFQLNWLVVDDCPRSITFSCRNRFEAMAVLRDASMEMEQPQLDEARGKG